jgi:stage V sporulation protein AD
MRHFDIPFISLYGACSTFGLATILGSIFIETKMAKNVITMASSHTQGAERTFRYPTEYGGAKEDSSTLTVTGCGAMLLNNKKSKIRISMATIGKVCDVGYKNSFDLGGAMAPSAIETLLTHFEDFKSKPSDYDMILTGDLSQIGRSMVQTALNKRFDNVKNYDDCGLIVYDYFEQDVFSGGSGCACSAVVTCGYIKEKMLNGELNKVLICPTGALMNQTTTLQKESIPAISHAFVLERVIE